MEEQKELKIEIGTTEPEKTSLKPAKVKIVGVKIEATTKSKKVVFLVKHPDRQEPIKISSVAYIFNREIVLSGTWFNLDKEEKLQKNSAVVLLLNKIGAKTLEESVGKEVETELDGKYLYFKIY